MAERRIRNPEAAGSTPDLLYPRAVLSPAQQRDAELFRRLFVPVPCDEYCGEDPDHGF